MNHPDAEKKLAMIETVVRACVIPESGMTDRQAISLILAILETGAITDTPAKPKLRVIDGTNEKPRQR